MNCAFCSTDFNPVRTKQKYCSSKCGQSGRYQSGNRGTDYQYKLASGNWELYYQRRIAEKQRSKSLTVGDLVALHNKQNGLCALTGVPLTCMLVRGVKTNTNASIDKIDASGEYVKENIQLVCVAVNRLRCDLSVDEFIDWCKKVTKFQGEKNGQ